MSRNKSKKAMEGRPARKNSRKSDALSMPLNPAEDTERNAWGQMYVIYEHWQSDMDFFCDELVFLMNLINKYFIGLLDDQNITAIQRVAGELSALDHRQIKVIQKLAQHGKHLTNLIENSFSQNAQQSKEEHAELEKEIATFVKDFRSVKRSVLNLSEMAIGSQKAKHILRQ